MLGVGALKAPAAAAAASGAAAPERSPWAPPGSAAVDGQAAHAEPAAGSGLTAAPVGPGVAPPIGPGLIAMPTPLAAPVVAPLLGTRAKPGDDPKGKFRDTMWFKKGELDSQAAQAAADEHARTGNALSDKADQLPIDERYKDDGSLSHTDKQLYSLRTGATQATAALRDAASQSGSDKAPEKASEKVSEDALIDEMKGGRNRVLAIIALALAVVAVLVFLIVR